jgi:hypothetical protein
LYASSTVVREFEFWVCMPLVLLFMSSSFGKVTLKTIELVRVMVFNG